MLEVLYRIYEVLPEDQRKGSDFGWSMSDRMSEELVMDVYCCETRDEFKAYIKDTYGSDIKFAFSSKYKAGQIYCIIIGEHLFESSKDKYFTRIEFDCAHCGQHVKTFSKNIHKISNWEIRSQLGNDLEKYQSLGFCNSMCTDAFIAKEHREHYADEVPNDFVDAHSYSYSGLAGYIYKISKKSTGEFYVGKTIYAPIFRWGQHLRTDRFALEDIADYQFETLEVVPKDVSLADRENYWIHECYNKNPDKSLNIAGLQKDRKLAEHEKKFKMKLGAKLDEHDTITNS